MTTPTFINQDQLAELINLFNVAEIALAGKSPTKYHRSVWAAETYHKRQPAISEIAAYKGLADYLAAAESVQIAA